jgi:hypothetical protein
MPDSSTATCQATPSRRRDWLALAGIVLLAVAIRSIGIDRPLVGNFATKNVVYAMIARNWAEGRTGLAYPMLDCLTGGGRSLHMLEFPVSAYLSGWLWRSFGGSLDVWGRATAVAFSGAAIGLLFLFVRRRHGLAAGAAAAAALALSPVAIIYGQNFMLEASLVFFTVATFYALDRRLAGGRWGWLGVAASCFAILLLTKVYMLVLVLPLAVAILHRRRAGENAEFSTQARRLRPAGSTPERESDHTPNPRLHLAVTLSAIGLAMVPAAVWYYHALVSVPTGPLAGRVYYSVRESVSDHAGTQILLASPDFWSQMLSDLTGVVLTPLGFALALAGLLDHRWRRYAAWFVACFLLMLVLPRKFYEMNYYWMAVLPPLCILVGLGWKVIREQVKPPRWATGCLLVVVLALSLRYALKPAFFTPDEDRGVVAAGRAVQELTGLDEPVVTMHGTTIDLLYYCDRPGWAVAPSTPELHDVLDDCRRRGARYLVIAGPEWAAPPEPLRPLKKTVEGDGFVVFELPGSTTQHPK